ncbi:MAG: M56 family metallopeptidase, partial [Acetatifactor sp.]|nr:M56 family metallopeptidase [Acetatifactor sp.]
MLGWAVTSGVLIILVLLMRQLFKGRISLRLQYGLWLLVLVRLLVPVNLFDTDVSVLNLLSVEQEADSPQIRPEQSAVSPDLWTDAALQLNGGQGNNVTNMSHTENINLNELSGAQGEELVYHSGESVKKAAWLSRLLWAGWVSGMIIVAAVLGGINLHFSRRIRRARKPLENSEGILPVYIVQGISSPCLFGLIHPAVYLPEGITEEQLPYVLAHEESHYRAGDHIWSMLRSLCLAIHWYHPLVWLAAYVSRQDSELACDERTIRRLGEERRNIYGRILVDLTVEKAAAIDFLCCATTMTADGRSLKERVQLIAHKPHMLAATGGILAALMVAVSCVACTGARADVAPEPDAVGDSELESEENGTPETEGESDESPDQEETDSHEEGTDGTNPAVDHVRSDNAYYRVVTDTFIDDPYFTMEVPEELVGQVAYGAVLKE